MNSIFRRKMLFFLSSALAALILWAPCGFANETPVTLVLNWKPEPQFGGFYAAELTGAYLRHHLKVDIQQGGSGTPSVQMVAAGQAAFGIVSADEVILNRAAGGDIVALFATYQTNPQALMAHSERGFKSIRDIYSSDGVLAIQKGLPYARFLAKKFSPLKVKIVPYLGGIANFLHDPKYSQQCFFNSEPLAAAKAGQKVATFLISDEGYNPYTTVVVTRAKYLKEHPDTAQAMVAAIREGWRAYLDQPEKANQMMNRLNPSMSPETFKESAEVQKPLIEPKGLKNLGEMSEERWRDLIQALFDLQLVAKKPEAKTLFRNLTRL